MWALESGENMIVLESIFPITRENGVRLRMEIDSWQEGQPGGALEGKRMAYRATNSAESSSATWSAPTVGHSMS